jgi:hypothetical protein
VACCLAPAVLTQGAEPRIDRAPGHAVDAQQSDASQYHWRKTDVALALMREDDALWQFNYDPQFAKPYFHPLATVTGQVLTWNQPPDHLWHHGLWFSWKYLNGVNFWEQNPRTGRPDGQTTWSTAQVETRDDDSASITLELSYRPANEGAAALKERRRIETSPPDADGVYFIDWTSTFTALQQATLDRTPPMPQSAGGYAGLSARFSKNFAEREAANLAGPINFDGDRYRGRSGALEYNGVVEGASVGLAMLDSPNNPRHPSPWYVIRSPWASYVNAAFLQDEPLTVAAGQQFTLRYRVVVHGGRWDAKQLQAAYREFVRQSAANSHE